MKKRARSASAVKLNRIIPLVRSARVHTSYTHIDVYENRIANIYRKLYGTEDHNIKELKHFRTKLESMLTDINNLIKNNE